MNDLQTKALEAHMGRWKHLQGFMKEHKVKSFLAGFQAATEFFIALENARLEAQAQETANENSIDGGQKS